jgi:hypothetical protein
VLKLIPFTLLLALTSGCAGLAVSQVSDLLGSHNSASLEIHNQTDVKLTESNFATVKTNVVGQCKGFALLGLITIVPAQFTVAMNRLYEKAEIPPGHPRTLADLVMERTSSYWILFSIPKVSVRADVVEFIPNTTAILVPQPPSSSSGNDGKHGDGL